MELITCQPKINHVSFDTIHEFEQAILSDLRIRQLPSRHGITSEVLYYLWLVLDKIHHRKSRVLPAFFESMLSREPCDYFAVLMGLDKLKCLPFFLFQGRKSIYLFDAWPNRFEKIKQFVECTEIDHVFLSSCQSVERLNGSVGRSTFHWIPEGINPEEYKYYPYEEKSFDVLHLGRRYDVYHEMIVASLKEEGRVYLYKTPDQDLIFRTREELVDGFARTKISICVPCSMTNPKRSGDIETMTIRYLQSMASKCLVLGHAPEEMIRLFGYNPVVEIDLNDAAGQLRYMLDNFVDYIPLIEKNYTAVTTHHTWQRRWEMITHVLFPESCEHGEPVRQTFHMHDAPLQ